MWGGSVTDTPPSRHRRALWGIAFAALALLAAFTLRPEAAQAQPAPPPAAAQVPVAAAPAATPAPAAAAGAPAAPSTAGGQSGALTRALGAMSGDGRPLSLSLQILLLMSLLTVLPSLLLMMRSTCSNALSRCPPSKRWIRPGSSEGSTGWLPPSAQTLPS